VLGVIREQDEGDAVQRGLDRAHLGQDVDAVPIVLDHLLQAADLSFDPSQTTLDLTLMS
jgi:hypothetical protein